MSTWSTCTWGIQSDIFFLRHDRSQRTQPIFSGVRTAWKKEKPEILHWLHRRPFCAKSYVICTLPLCDWSVQQSANKPQSQKEKNVVRLWAAVSLGERCVTLCLPVFNFFKKRICAYNEFFFRNLQFKNYQLIYSLWWLTSKQRAYDFCLSKDTR